MIALLRDVTEQRRLQEEIQKLNTELEARVTRRTADKLAMLAANTVTRFAPDLAADFLVDVRRFANAAIAENAKHSSSDAVVSGPFVVAGWALDPKATMGTGIDTLHAWAYRRDYFA